MKTAQQIDAHARDLPQEVQASVYGGSKAKTERRREVLFAHYENPNGLRKLAGKIKQHTLEHLDKYLALAEKRLQARGVHVHFAADAASANRQIGDILEAHRAKLVVKSKSMVTEETELGPYLEGRGITAIETDLGEFIVQIDGDHPSHIVTPIVHKNRRDIARSFEKHGLGAYNDDPETITRRARVFLRDKYFEADAAITGANFVSAESGRIVLVTNEGNARFCLAAPPLHIAVVGIEKLVPADRDLAVFLNLLARSATGQQLTVYTQFVGAPAAAHLPDGSRAMHVVFMDNGRTDALASDCREILRCIRCGACLNVCPVYRQAGGHAYRSVYPGPVGAVLSPLLAGARFPELADLPKASSLCGACNEVCPVDIPLSDLLVRLRDRAKREGASAAMKGTPPMGLWSLMASQPAAWKTALRVGSAIEHVPHGLIPVPALHAWEGARQLPPWRGGAFRQWLRTRVAPTPASPEAKENHE